MFFPLICNEKRGYMRSNRFGLRFFPIAALVATLCLAATPGWSQATSSSTVGGLVTDEQGAVIVGAEVKLIDSETGRAQSKKPRIKNLATTAATTLPGFSPK